MSFQPSHCRHRYKLITPTSTHRQNRHLYFAVKHQRTCAAYGTLYKSQWLLLREEFSAVVSHRLIGYMISDDFFLCIAAAKITRSSFHYACEYKLVVIISFDSYYKGSEPNEKTAQDGHRLHF